MAEKKLDLEHLVDVGSNARIERRAMAEQEPHLGPDGKQLRHPVTGVFMTKTKLDRDGNGIYKWIIYEKVHTGLQIADEHKAAHKAGQHIDEHGIVHAHMVKVAQDDDGNNVRQWGKHPVIKDKAGQPIETAFEYVWVPRGEAMSKEEAMAKAAKIKGAAHG